MSSLRPIDFRLIDELVDFVRGRGYVLNFSDASFSEFFADELDFDVDDPEYVEDGGSKGKRLCSLTGKITPTQSYPAAWTYSHRPRG